MTSGIIAEDIAGILGDVERLEALAGRRFLVTGATGMVGQYLVRAFLELGRRTAPTHVVAMTRRGEEAARLFASEAGDASLEIVVHDPACGPPPGPMDYIVHAASPANPVAFRDDPVGVISANVDGAANLLAAAKACDAVFCFLSSAEVYGPAAPPDGRRLAESAPGVLDSLDPRSAYPESKRLVEALCVAYERQHSVAYRIARLAHTYGPGMDLQDPRVQAYFMRQALRGEDIILQSDGTARRTYTYVSDAVSGLLHLMAAPESLACNIANESATVSIADLGREVLRACPGTAAELKFAPGAHAGSSATVEPPILDCTRLRELGWVPRVDLPTGIRRTLAHHRALMATPAGERPDA